MLFKIYFLKSKYAWWYSRSWGIEQWKLKKSSLEEHHQDRNLQAPFSESVIYPNCLKRLLLQNIKQNQFKLKTIPNNWNSKASTFSSTFFFCSNFSLRPLPSFLSFLSFLVELCPQKAYVKSQPLYLLMWPYLGIESSQMDLVKMRSYWIRVVLKSNTTMSS